MQSNRRPLPYPLKIRVQFENELYHEQIYLEYPITIGRNENCSISLKDFDFVSRQHCVVTVDDGNLFLVDLNSANGFLHNGKQARRLEITTNTQVSIGELTLDLFPQTEKDLPPPIPEKEPKTKVVHVAEPSIREKTIIDIAPEDLPPPQSLQANIPDLPKFAAKKEKTQEALVDTAKTAMPSKHKQGPAVSPPVPFPVQAHTDSVHGKLVSAENHSEKFFNAHHLAKELKPSNRVLEAFVKWEDQVYDHQHFYPDSKITLGVSEHANLKLPTLGGDLGIAFYDGTKSNCLIPNGAQASLNRNNQIIAIEDLVKSGVVARRSKGYLLQLENQDVLTVHYSPSTSVLLRYAPAPKRLSKTPMLNPDEEIKRSITISGLVHIFLLILLSLGNPPQHLPTVPNVKPRYVKLMVQPPKPLEKKPTPTPTPQPTPEPTPRPTPPKKERATPPPKRIPPQPKRPIKTEQPRVVQKKPTEKITVSQSKTLSKVNTFPMTVEKPAPKIESLGALGALGTMKPSANQVPQVAVNINPNAGGRQGTMSTSNIVAGLKSAGGKLSSGGEPGVKTRGLGQGTGTGYGTQGLQGGAGTRAVGGAVIGTPKLATIGQEEGLTRKQVMDTLQKYVAQIQRCYERSLFDNPELKGRVEYQWEITPRGGVNWVKVLKTDMSGADSLNDCVKKVFMSMQFPTAKNGQTTLPNIGFPFGRL